MASTMASTLTEMLSHNPITITALVVAVSLVVVRIFRSVRPLPGNLARYKVDHDLLGDSKKTQVSDAYPSMTAAIQKAYSASRKAAFIITGKRPWVWTEMTIIPPEYIDDLKNLPEDKLSSVDAINDHMNLNLTRLTPSTQIQDNAVIKTIAVQLTRKLSKVMDDLDDEVAFSINKYMPACDDWIEVYLGAILPQIVSQASGRVLVGLPLCRDEEFIESTVTYTINAFNGGDALTSWPRMLRKFVAPWLKIIRICYKQQTSMEKMLKSQLEERIAMIEQGAELPDDFMTWLMENSADEHKFELSHQAYAQLGTSMAAIHTTTMTTTNALLDLAARPEYLQPLREEWTDVLSAGGSHAMAKSSMPKLKKLDSFLKESQRLYPLGPTTFERKVNSDLLLPDGTFLPKGSYIAAPTQAIGMDGSKWEDPDKFDGFRFSKLRQQPGSESRYQFVTTGVETMNFGHGKHACPGRFFAANEIKLILSYILRNYDMKLKDGQERPESILIATGMRPDYTVPILMKRRQK